MKNTNQAKLICELPSSLYRMFTDDSETPKIGNIVTLDQGFTSPDGQPMVLAYCFEENGTERYEADVYEYELSPPL